LTRQLGSDFWKLYERVGVGTRETREIGEYFSGLIALGFDWKNYVFGKFQARAGDWLAGLRIGVSACSHRGVIVADASGGFCRGFC
jgi:hypothetical protein